MLVRWSYTLVNLSLEGGIYIKGAVRWGFSVKADGDITVMGTVEPGGNVISRGDITVGEGVVGRRTQVVAGGNVRADFVREASVTAGQDIVLHNYAHHARLRAGGKVIVSNGKGEMKGSIVGGQIWARKGIDAHIVGNPAGVITTLMTGLDPDQARELDKLTNIIYAAEGHILWILGHFYLTRIDVVQIRQLISAATGPRRRLLAHYARQLGQLVQLCENLLAKRNDLEEQIGATLQGTEIQVRDTAFPGVLVRLGNHQRKLTAEIKALHFRLEDGKLAER